MLKLNLKNKKYFFLISFRYIFLNYNYLLFFKSNSLDLNISLIIKECSDLNIGFKNVIGRDFNKLFNNNFFIFLKNNHYLCFFNDYSLFTKIFNKLNIFILYSMSFLGYFLNNNYLKNINNIYFFNNNNYNKYILYIYLFINKYIYNIYLLCNLLLKLFINFEIKLN